MDDVVLLRLMQKIDTHGPGGCWLWTGAVNGTGYGHAYYPGAGRKAWPMVHRTIYQLVKGPIPQGMQVLHTCDVPRCCNPGHLYLGTISDNMRDRSAKGRGNHPRGEAHYNAKFTEDDVRAMRASVADGETRASVAKRYGASAYIVGRIVSRKNWRHVL